MLEGAMTTHIDPVCGMTVDPTKNKGGSFDYNGTTYYFCSPGCRTKFEADPSGWVKSGPKGMGAPKAQPVTLTLKRTAAPQHSSTPAPQHASTAVWICPMDPE